jgi:hypothetical protein
MKSNRASINTTKMPARSAEPIGELSVKVYRDVATLQELREFWGSRQTWPAGNLDFFLTVVCSSPEVVRPHVIVLFRDNQPQSLLLGRLERKKITVRLGYLRVTSPTLNILTFDDAGWLRDVCAADSELFVREILNTLRNGEAEAANLHHLDTTHWLSQLAKSLPGRLCSDHLPLVQVHWVRRFAANRSFSDSLSANERYNQRRRARRLFDAFGGEVRVECFHDGTRIEQLMNAAEAVARTSYQRGLGVGFVHDERTQRRLRLAAQQGVLRAHVLYLADKPCAFWIASLFGGVLYNEFMAYDPAYAQYGPGSYLAFKVIEEVCSDNRGSPVTALDFGPGDAEWKARLGNHQRRLTSLYIFAPTLKAAACNLMRTLAGLADHCVKAILARTGLLTTVKRKWRRLVAQGQGDT